jgi:hypothetical protein
LATPPSFTLGYLGGNLLDYVITYAASELRAKASSRSKCAYGTTKCNLVYILAAILLRLLGGGSGVFFRCTVLYELAVYRIVHGTFYSTCA